MVPYAQDCFGVPYLHIHRADYHKILVDEAKRLGVDILLGSNVASVDFEKPSIKLVDNAEFHADVVVGADGLKSACREALLGRPDPPCFTGDLAYRIIIKAEDMKKYPDLRELVEKPAINYWLGPRSHVVCYLLKGGGLYNVVLICPDNLPSLVTTAKADLEEMRDIFKNWDPTLKALLELVQEASKWRLQNSQEMKSWRHPSGKFALLGDACHATLPYLYVSFVSYVTFVIEIISDLYPPELKVQLRQWKMELFWQHCLTALNADPKSPTSFSSTSGFERGVPLEL